MPAAHQTSMACTSPKDNTLGSWTVSSGTTSRAPATRYEPPSWWSAPWTSPRPLNLQTFNVRNGYVAHYILLSHLISQAVGVEQRNFYSTWFFPPEQLLLLCCRCLITTPTPLLPLLTATGEEDSGKIWTDFCSWAHLQTLFKGRCVQVCRLWTCLSVYVTCFVIIIIIRRTWTLLEGKQRPQSSTDSKTAGQN